MLPGNLFQELQSRGFRQIPVKGFLSETLNTEETLSIESTLELHRILDGLEPAMANIQSQMIGWTSLVEKDFDQNPISCFNAWESLTGKDIESFTKELEETCGALLNCIKILKERGPTN